MNRIVGMLLLPACLALGWIAQPLLPHLPTICAWKRWFHVDCPTCGLTRAFCLFAHGDFAAAAAMNALVFPLYAIIVSVSAVSLARTLRDRHGTPRPPQSLNAASQGSTR
jgi:hypothetical protein